MRRPSAPKTANACLSCKEKRIKCTGQPSPCQACKKTDRYCHFDLRLDARRRKAGELSATQRQHWFILESLLRSIKFNDRDMVQRLVEAIRSDESPQKVAETFRANIQLVDHLGELTKQDISDADIITLVLQCLSYPSPGSRTNSLDSETRCGLLRAPSSSFSDSSSISPPSSYAVSFDEAFHSAVQSSSVDDEGGIGDELAPHDIADIGSMTTYNLVNMPASASSGQPMCSADIDSGILLPTIGLAQVVDFEAELALSENQSQHRRFSLPGTLQSGGVYGGRSFMKGWDHMRNPSLLRTFTLPLIYPGDPVNDIVLAFRDKARDLLKSGASLRSIMGSGPTDVELLFRPRQSDDEWNVPNWACETTSDLEDFDFHVRLSQVFMRIRFMRWLILPNAEMFTGIPGILKPTVAQMRFPHSVAIDFLPIPAVRNSLVRQLRDWQTLLSRAKYSCNWSESLGPAVITDPISGRRCLSAQFEKHICVYQNWSASSNILETWPELSGELTLDRAI
ncbi:hypothetical protein PV08_11069 [Exophiala spinifera]|uniref:Zn(2)-C6 fungal-type domain-containing protein n=1 Tax=Exophiala spinifera TaxID=91928 RepID=A0A0D2BFI7_9EURO|nr:uncharacterized protein PV08_11069 [Exophiala spinifera]KIW10109.1 hypothetical protein PV08_11069 [Exophiala spinifera]